MNKASELAAWLRSGDFQPPPSADVPIQPQEGEREGKRAKGGRFLESARRARRRRKQKLQESRQPGKSKGKRVTVQLQECRCLASGRLLTATFVKGRKSP